MGHTHKGDRKVEWGLAGKKGFSEREGWRGEWEEKRTEVQVYMQKTERIIATNI